MGRIFSLGALVVLFGLTFFFTPPNKPDFSLDDVKLVDIEKPLITKPEKPAVKKVQSTKKLTKPQQSVKWISKSPSVAYDEPPSPIGGFGAIQGALKYPEIARKAGIQGRVIVQVLVSEKGKVVDAQIIQSLGHSGCDVAAIKAIQSVNWKPASRGYKPVPGWIAIPVIFKLK